MLPHSSATFKVTVGVRPSVPKLSPLMVTVPPPLCTAFAEAVLATGAASATVGGEQRVANRHASGEPSKLNIIKVPATALTLTAVRTAEPPYAAGPHATVVADVHVVLLHMSPTPRDALGVTTNPPKPRPPIVMVPPPVAPTVDGLLMLTHGAATATKEMQRCELQVSRCAGRCHAFSFCRRQLRTRTYHRS